ncbi:hypothetical protein BRADI_1g27150v3 [Brachypodium distachyon]|uniref:DUF1618 domain-containing protein n=1 Tax=Brachypodium distachyon TaxID=15368 RepID=A0A0Q3RSV5_BRADI|nr:hypothetical protein BRADI_1g27150v3 [Brachypodium distachyon]
MGTANVKHGYDKLDHPHILITPHTLVEDDEDHDWPTTFSSNIRFYEWQQGASEASLVHDRNLNGEFNSVCSFAHCDGLVLLPTDINPATRDTVTLPESSNNKIPGLFNLPMGFGRDPRTGMYKVARSFVRSIDPDIDHMGMEIFTIGPAAASAACWRETAADQPYPVIGWLTAQCVKEAMYWVIDRYLLSPRPYGLLRFSLEDETFVCRIYQTPWLMASTWMCCSETTFTWMRCAESYG